MKNTKTQNVPPAVVMHYVEIGYGDQGNLYTVVGAPRSHAQAKRLIQEFVGAQRAKIKARFEAATHGAYPVKPELHHSEIEFRKNCGIYVYGSDDSWFELLDYAGEFENN